MNEDRRQVGKLVIALLQEGSSSGEISDESHEALGEALAHLNRQEFHQLRAQEKYEGKNASTDKQIAICRVAGPALEHALEAYNSDNFAAVMQQLTLAIETDGTVPRKAKARRRKK